jgi:hypothetical protein
MTAAIHRLSRRRFAAAFALPLLAPAIPTHAARQEVAEDASALLVRAAAAMAGLASFHFALSTPRGATTILDAFELVRLEGDVLRPDRYRATIDATAAGFDVSVEAIGVGDRLWVTDPMAGGAFREFPLDAAAGDGPTLEQLVNPDRLWLAALAAVTDAVVVGENAIDGEPVTRVDGMVDLSRVLGERRAATAEAGVATEAEVETEGPTETADLMTPVLDPLPVSVWLAASGHLRRLEVEGPLLTGEEPNVVRRLDFTRFDEPVTIEPPPVG